MKIPFVAPAGAVQFLIERIDRPGSVEVPAQAWVVFMQVPGAAILERQKGCECTEFFRVVSMTDYEFDWSAVGIVVCRCMGRFVE